MSWVQRDIWRSHGMVWWTYETGHVKGFAVQAQWISLSVAGLLCAAWPAAGFRPPSDPPLPNYDQRRTGQATGLASAAGQVTPPARAQAAAALRARVPGVQIDFDDLLQTPRYIGSPHGFLTGPGGEGKAVSADRAKAFAATDPHRAIKAFLAEHRALIGHGPESLAGARLVRDYVTRHNGLRTVVWQQERDGIPVADAFLVGHITRRGELVNLSSQFVPELAEVERGRAATPKVQPQVTAVAAVLMAAAEVGEQVPPAEVWPYDPAPQGPDQRQRFTVGVLPGKAEARLVWLPMDRRSVRLCWRVEITRQQGGERYCVFIDVETGQPLVRRRLTQYLQQATYRVYVTDSPTPLSPGHPWPSTNQPPEVPRSLVSWPALNTNASPLGWITDGLSETLGNNVDAHLDRDGDDQPDLPRPNGGPERVFDFPLDLSQHPATYGEAAALQLFYWCNWMHDRLYELGFDEASGNFQKDNFGRGGRDGDLVLADAQDGSGFNNANFTPTDDGVPPRIQMFLFTGTDPPRDGDLDAEVILHEYTHGLTWRLVGGGYGLWDAQALALAEGWSDFYALALLSEPGDDVDGVYPIGAYVSLGYRGLRDNYYFGIRRYPYCTDLARSPLTFKDIDPTQADPHRGVPFNPIYVFDPYAAGEPHRAGEVWCAVLWEARANFIRKYGFELGQPMFLRLVTDALKLTPPNPTFLQARDALLQADWVNHDGWNQNELWAAFAKRGMGVSAYGPPVWTTEGVVESYAVPDPLWVTPVQTALFSGPAAGPLAPQCWTYVLTNHGPAAVDWVAVPTASWLEISPASGTLGPGAGTNFTLCLGSQALGLAAGTYTATVLVSNLTAAVFQTRQVSLQVLEAAAMPFVETFNAGSLGPFWTVTGSDAAQTEVSSTGGPAEGQYHLTMASRTDGTYARNEATLTLDLAGYTNVVLRFWARKYGDHPHGPPPSPFRFGADFDGVAVSTDGVSWYEVQDLRAVSDFYSDFVVDLDAALARYGLTYNSAFRIRFNQYGNRPLPNGGIAIDDIQVSGVAPRRFTVVLPSEVTEGDGPLPEQGQVVLPLPVQEPVTVNLVSSDPTAVRVPATVVLPAGTNAVAFELKVGDDTLLNGVRTITVTASAPGYLSGRAAVRVQDNEQAVLHLSVPAQAREGQGILRAAGRITASLAPVLPITVALSVTNPAELRVPSAVTLPAGQTNVSFDIEIVDDRRIDGPTTNFITARVPNWSEATVSLVVLDNDSTNLTVQLPSLVSEGAGSLLNAGSVRLAGTLPTNLVVRLASSDTNRLTVPGTVLIGAGQMIGYFTLKLVNDSQPGPVQQVRVEAWADGFQPGSGTVQVLDDDVPPLAYAPNPTNGSVGNPLNLRLEWRLGYDGLLTNGGFELGSLAGWVPTGNVDGGWVLNDGALDPPGPEGPMPPRSGRFSVVSVQTSPGTRLLYQDVTLPQYVSQITLAWAHRIRNWGPRFAYDHGFRVEIRDLGDSPLAVAFSTQSTSPLLGEWTECTYDLSTYRGRTVRLAFVESDSLGFLNVHLDDVRVLLNFGGITTSEVFLGTSPQLGPLDWLGATSNTTWTPPALALDTTYYWQIVTRRTEAETLAGPLWQFRTRDIGPLAQFGWSSLAPTQWLGQPIPVVLTAQDDLGNTVSNFSGTVTLTATRRRVIEPVQILCFTAYADMAHEYRRTIGAIGAHFTNFTVSTTVTTNPATLQDQLANTDVLLIVEQESANRATLSALSVAWAPVLSNFVQHGGTVIACSYLGSEHMLLTNAGLLMVNKVRAVGAQELTATGAHPVTEGLSAPFMGYDVALYEVIDGTGVVHSTTEGYAAVVAQTVGAGRVVLIGSDYPTNRTGLDRVLANAIRWAQSSPTVSLPLSPTRSGYFFQGSWAGEITPLDTGEEVTLTARDNAGHQGTSPPFTVQAANDLAVSLADAPDPVLVGQSVTYTAVVRNSGPATRAGVRLVDRLPAELRFVSASSSLGSCALTNNIVTCDLGLLPGGAQASVWITAVANAGGRITNTVTVSGSGPEPVSANNTAVTVTHVGLPGLSISDATVAEGDEGTVPLTFTVKLAPPSGQWVWCDYATADLLAVSNLDYLPVSGTLAFPPGATQQTITVSAVGDRLSEGLETFQVRLLRATNALVVGPVGTGIIMDDDPMPVLTVREATVQEGPARSRTNLVFEAQLSAPSGQTVSVDYSTSDGTAQAGRDYLPASGTLTFPPGTTNQTITVTVLGDSLSESNETVLLSLGAAVGAQLQQTLVTGWILDDDQGRVAYFTWSPVPATQWLGQPFEVSLTARDGFGQPVEDFVGPVYLTAVAATRVLSVGSDTDLWDYPMGTYYHDQRLQAIYLADELGGRAQQLSGLSLLVAEPPGQPLHQWTIRLKHVPWSTFPKAQWEDTGWTTVYQADEAVTEPGWVTFRFTTPFDFNGTNHLLVDLSFNNSFYSSNGRCYSSSTDGPRSLYFRTDSAFGDPLSWSGQRPFPQAASRVPTIQFQADTTLPMTPTVVSNFVQGSWRGQIVLGDLAPSVWLQASDAQGHFGTGNLFTVSALNDLSVRLSAAPVPVSIDEQLTYTLWVTNTGPNPATEVVVIDQLPPNALWISSDASQGSCSHQAGQVTCHLGTLPAETAITVTIVVAPRSLELLTNWVVVQRGEPDVYPANNTATLITPVAPPRLFIEDARGPEGDTGTNFILFTLRLSAPHSEPVTVKYFTRDGTATNGLDYLAVTGIVTLAPGTLTQQVTVPILGDLADEPDETFSVVLTNAVNVVLARAVAVGTIQDDDPPPALSVEDVTVSEGDTGYPVALFPVRLSAPSALIVRFTAATSNGTATAGADYVATTRQLMFPPGITNLPVAVVLRPDTMVEPDEYFYLHLLNPSNATLARAQAVCTILNDDGVPGRLERLEWAELPRYQMVNQPFTVMLRGLDADSGPATQFTGPVRLSARTGQFDATVGASQAQAWAIPLGTGYHDARTQVIYRTNELGGARRFTAAALDVILPPGQPLNQFTIRLKHTPLASYASNLWEDSGWTVVYQADTTVYSTGWVSFPFMQPFDYNGQDNLMVDLSFDNWYFTSDGLCRFTLTNAVRTLAASTDSQWANPISWAGPTAPTPTGYAGFPNLKLIAGADVPLMPTVSGSFDQGTWTGQVTIRAPCRDVMLVADDQAGHLAFSSRFSVVEPEGDLDGDGLADGWELTYFGSLDAPQGGPADDPDGDGATNLHEYYAGTNPLDPASVLVLTEIVRDAHQVRLRFLTVQGRAYRVEQTSELLKPNWSALVQLQGTGTVVEVTDTQPVGLQRFYRVRLLP